MKLALAETELATGSAMLGRHKSTDICLQNLLAAAPVDVADDKGEEQNLRERAREALAVLL